MKCLLSSHAILLPHRKFFRNFTAPSTMSERVQCSQKAQLKGHLQSARACCEGPKSGAARRHHFFSRATPSCSTSTHLAVDVQWACYLYSQMSSVSRTCGTRTRGAMSHSCSCLALFEWPGESRAKPRELVLQGSHGFLILQIWRIRPRLDPLPAPYRLQRPRSRFVPLRDPPRGCRPLAVRHLDRRRPRAPSHARSRLAHDGGLRLRLLLVRELCRPPSRRHPRNHLAERERGRTVCRARAGHDESVDCARRPSQPAHVVPGALSSPLRSLLWAAAHLPVP